MNGILQTVPSFVINKKEFFLLWVKQMVTMMNVMVVEERVKEMEEGGVDHLNNSKVISPHITNLLNFLDEFNIVTKTDVDK